MTSKPYQKYVKNSTALTCETSALKLECSQFVKTETIVLNKISWRLPERSGTTRSWNQSWSTRKCEWCLGNYELSTLIKEYNLDYIIKFNNYLWRTNIESLLSTLRSASPKGANSNARRDVPSTRPKKSVSKSPPLLKLSTSLKFFASDVVSASKNVPSKLSKLSTCPKIYKNLQPIVMARTLSNCIDYPHPDPDKFWVW